MSVAIWEGQKAQELINAISGNQKVDRVQGQIFAGKSLVVGDDGIVGVGDVGLSEDAKLALLNCLRHVAYTDEHGAEYVGALETALFSGKTEIWDFEWNYLKGLPSNYGMELTNGGTGNTISIVSDGLSIATADSTSNIVRYKKTPAEALYSNGVWEYVFRVDVFGSYNAAPYGNGIRMNCGFGQYQGGYKKGVELCFNQSGVLYLAQADSGSGSVWKAVNTDPFEVGVLYKIRVEQNDVSGANVYVNGHFVGNVSTSEMYENVGPSQFIVLRGAAVTVKTFRYRLGN